MIQRIQHRDPEALAKLYDAYNRLTYSLILRIVHDKCSAEDLVQETFLRVWTRACLFDFQKGAVVPWLLTIARNRALDYLRSSHGRRNYCSNLDNSEDPKSFADIERSASMSHTNIGLHDALQKLGDNQRAALDLAYFEGYTQTEIAAKLGYPLGTVKTWVRSALKALREEFHASIDVNTRRRYDPGSNENDHAVRSAGSLKDSSAIEPGNAKSKIQSPA